MSGRGMIGEVRGGFRDPHIGWPSDQDVVMEEAARSVGVREH